MSDGVLLEASADRRDGELKVPTRPEEVTAEWLTAALARRIPGAVVHELEALERIHGASSKLRLRLRLNAAAEAAGVTRQVILKAGFENHSPGLEVMHRNEVNAYRHLAPSADVPTAACFYADCDSTGRAVVVLEDLTLRNVEFLSLQRPISYALAERFLDHLAKLHARWWNAPDLAAQTWVLPSHGEYRRARVEALLAPASYEAFVNAPRGAATPQALKDPDLIRRCFFRLGEHYARMPQLIVHGDMHLGNLFVFADGEPGVLDWQPRLATWSNDVTYFLVGGLDLPDRRRWEQPLLNHYLDQLRALGVDAPSFDEAWLAHRRDVMWGFYVWLFNGFTYQSESNNTAACTRFATAMIDHDTVAALLG